MQTSTVIVLACLIAVVVAAQLEHHPEELQRAYETVHDSLAHKGSSRQKRGLLLLKKKLLLGAIGLKAVKVGAVAGALALKSKSGYKHHDHSIKLHSDHQHKIGHPQSYVQVHDWSG